MAISRREFIVGPGASLSAAEFRHPWPTCRTPPRLTPAKIAPPHWESIGGLKFLPGTFSSSDHFARASFPVGAIPRKADPHFIKGIPDQSFVFQAVASVLGVMQAVSVPIGVGVPTPGQPDVSSTIWRTVSDSTHLTYYFDSASRPNTFWVSPSKLDLKPGSPVKKLTIQNGEIFLGEVSAKFTDANPFNFLPG